MAPSRWDRRRGSPSTCPAPPAPRRCSSAAPPARSPHPPPALPRLPRSGDVSDPVPAAAAASSVPARSRRPPSPSLRARPWLWFH